MRGVHKRVMSGHWAGQLQQTAPVWRRKIGISCIREGTYIGAYGTVVYR